jgi:hypothetical protein
MAEARQSSLASTTLVVWARADPVRERPSNTGTPTRLASARIGSAPGFDLGRLGSNPRGAAIFHLRGIAQLVERGFHTPRQPQVRSLLPRPSFAGLAKWEGNGSWPRHEAVRSRQPVRACSSSVERRPPKPRQRGFNSFLARHQQSGRILVPVPFAAWHGIPRVGMDWLCTSGL